MTTWFFFITLYIVQIIFSKYKLNKKRIEILTCIKRYHRVHTENWWHILKCFEIQLQNWIHIFVGFCLLGKRCSKPIICFFCNYVCDKTVTNINILKLYVKQEIKIHESPVICSNDRLWPNTFNLLWCWLAEHIPAFHFFVIR